MTAQIMIKNAAKRKKPELPALFMYIIYRSSTILNIPDPFNPVIFKMYVPSGY